MSCEQTQFSTLKLCFKMRSGREQVLSRLVFCFCFFSGYPCLPDTADRAEANARRTHCQSETPQKSLQGSQVNLLKISDLQRCHGKSAESEQAKGSDLVWASSS